MNELKQFKVSDYFDKLFKLIATKNFLKYFGIFSLINIPYFIILLYLKNIIKIFDKWEIEYNLFDPMKNIVIDVINNFPFSFFTAIFIYMFYLTFFNKKCSIKESYKTVNNKIFMIILLFILYILSLNIPLAFLNHFVISKVHFYGILFSLFKILINGVKFFYIITLRLFFCFLIIIIVLEKNKFFEQSVQRAFGIAYKNFWKNFGLIILLSLIEAVILLILIFVPVIIRTILKFGSFFENINLITVYFLEIIQHVVNLLFFWPNIAFYVLMYINQRVKFEGFGVEMMIDDYVKHSDNDLI